MNIRFFDDNGVLDNRAIYAGVYRIRLQLKNKPEKSITLYLGESYSMIARCGDHIYNLINNDPAYFGLSREHLSDDRLELVFEVCESVDIPGGTSNSERDRILQDVELEKIMEEKPISQNETNDNLRKDRTPKVAEQIDKLIKEL